MRSVCVFCGSAAGQGAVYAQAARELGAALAARGWTLVFGGGRVGLMGEVATATRQHGGQVIGIIPERLAAKEIAFTDGTELHVVDSMHTRKALMADRADAFVALPGGYGTCDELFEILTWAQLGFHRKPIGLLNVNGFFTPLLAWLDQIVNEGLLKPKHRRLLLVRDSIPELLDTLATWQAPVGTDTWLLPENR